MTYKVAILASGQGTTAESFIRAGMAGQTGAQVELVICNNQGAGILDRIANLNQEFGLNITCLVINGTNHPPVEGEVVQKGHQTQAEESAILKALEDGDFDLIMQMGYLKKVGSQIVQTFGWQPDYVSPYQAMMLNSHPGLLPETAGTYGIATQQLTLDKKMPFGGQTLHVVSEKYDEGPTIAEYKVAVEADDTAETLFARVQTTEKEHLPGDIDAFLEARQAYFRGGKE